MSASAASDTPRIFVSHSHSDNAYCRAFVAALRHALSGNDEAVWYDEHNLGWGNIRRTIERELEQRQHFIAILSPAAVESQWVNDEIDAALGLLREGTMRTVSFVTAEKCEVPRLLRGYKRVEPAGGAGYPPAEAAARVLRFIWPAASPLPATPPPSGVELPGKPEPAPVPKPVRAILPRERFPEQLKRMGFEVHTAEDPTTGKEVAYLSPPMCHVPAGPFLMGSDPQHDSLALDLEMPQHEVTLPVYQIARFPVTVAEYACFVAAGQAAPRKNPLGTDWQTQLTRPDHPVAGVSWYDAYNYAVWVARLTGLPFALPSEAEWEKAARWDASGNGGSGVARIYPWGNDFDSARCNTLESRIRGTTAVGTNGPEQPDRDGVSPCGAQDMAGNVWEWTRTIYDAHAYSNGAPLEDADATDNRVLRGGSWRTVSRNARSASRNSGPPDYAGVGIGFRLVRLSATP